MSVRQSRSASIPIPRTSSSTSPTRNIESVISIPFAPPPPRPRLASAQVIPIAHHHSDDPRASVRGARFGASSVSPTRPSAHSPRTTDPACLSTSSSSSPTLPRARRPSATGPRTPSSNRAVSGLFPPAPAPRTSFTRPAYLEHSALRHLLQTESLPTIAPSRKQGQQRSLSPATDSDDEGSPPPRRATPVPDSSSQMLKLPTRMSESCRHELLSISPDGRDVTYQETLRLFRTAYPIPPACGIYYYEVDILSKGNKGHISIGFAGKDVRLSRLPGWEQNSWGYHGDDGCSFAAEKNGTPFGPTFGTGDTIGCGIDFSTHQAFFTKNGNLIGSVFKDIGKSIDLYPSIGLRHSGEAVRVNFGQEAFRFDIEYHVHQQRLQAWSNIQTTPISSSLVSEDMRPKAKAVEVTEERTKSAINKLVLAYLAHHGYARTARTFQKQLGRPSTDNLLGLDGDMELRTQIVNSVAAGDIDTALAETKKHYPEVLQANEGLMLFKLRCRKFIELLLDATELHKKLKAEEEQIATDDEDEMLMDPPVPTKSHLGTTSKAQAEALNKAIIYGQALLHDYKADKRPEVQTLFNRSVGIVAWHDPIEHGGVAAEVAGPEARVDLANELNQAILRSQGRPAHPTLETIYRHTAVCIQQLGVSGVGAAAFADMQKEFIDA
ncbi:SPRY-domain-containing protein [Roridomyces roridus]|uniref:SPRY-domain-containing protein n=1 Tax=Roridomyces roridus TaxID=1738132 RepID=A0AAD7FNX3_9AGAR|nr:SPRY-domain-containing protein [Roridomyces roridus]